MPTFDRERWRQRVEAMLRGEETRGLVLLAQQVQRVDTLLKVKAGVDLCTSLNEAQLYILSLLEEEGVDDGG